MINTEKKREERQRKEVEEREVARRSTKVSLDKILELPKFFNVSCEYVLHGLFQ